MRWSTLGFLATLIVSAASVRLLDEEEKPDGNAEVDALNSDQEEEEEKQEGVKMEADDFLSDEEEKPQAKVEKALGKIDEKSKDDVWYEGTQYLKKKKFTKLGSKVNQAIHADMVSKAGAEVRGIVSGKAMKNNTKLLVIPKKAWVNLDNFPAMRDSDLDCSSSISTHEAKIATALAIEEVAGDKSKMRRYLDTLPGKEDFRAFYPKWIKAPLMEEFKELSLVKNQLKAYKKDEKTAETCWNDWKKKADIDGLGDVKWDDVRLGLARWRSRNHATGDESSNHSHALLPAADLMNTGPSINTRWYFKDTDDDGHVDAFNLVIDTAGGAKQGDELLEHYCSKCKNEEMLNIWGIYVEDNTNPMDKQPEGCEALMKKVKPMLKDSKPHNLLAPRCKEETLKKEQGPLRCSLARLSWESCADEKEAKKKEKKDEEKKKEEPTTTTTPPEPTTTPPKPPKPDHKGSASAMLQGRRLDEGMRYDD